MRRRWSVWRLPPARSATVSFSVVRARVDDAGMTFVFVRIPAKTLKRVAKVRRARATLRLTVADRAGGNRQTLQRRLTLRR